MATPSRSKEELQKLRVVDLRKELSSHSLPIAGKKDELIQRLYDFCLSQTEVSEEEDQSSASTSDVSELKQIVDDAVKASSSQPAESETEPLEAAAVEDVPEENVPAEDVPAEDVGDVVPEQVSAEQEPAEEHPAHEEPVSVAQVSDSLEQEHLERMRAETEKQEREAEQQRLEEHRAREEKLRLEEEAHKEKQRLEAEHRAHEEEQRLEAERKAHEEEQRLEKERRAHEEKQRLEAERKAHEEQQRLEAEQRALEEQRLEQERQAKEELQRLAVQEQQRLAAQEQQHLAEQEQQRLVAEEQQRLAVEEQQRLVAEKQQHLAVEEQKRLTEEQEELKRRKGDGEAMEREREMMTLVNQQQTLLSQQKSAHEASQRHSRMLQEQRQQLEAALRQNSLLQSQNKGNQTILEQLQQQRNQLLAQGEAISSQQSTLSEQANTYMDQRLSNEQLMKQVMEQQQLKESEQQKTLLMERQQRFIAEQQQLQLAQQQVLEQQARSTELLRQQQIALLERQREQEETMRRLHQENLARENLARENLARENLAREERVLALRREEELRLQKEAVAKLEVEKRRQAMQEKGQASGPPSLLSLDAKPATAGLKLAAAADADSERKLPKALEDVLALKDIRAKQVGVEDMEQAVEESRSSVTVRSTTGQRPLGDVNEYDDDEDEEDRSTSKTKESKNKRRKKKKKTRGARKAEERAAAAAAAEAAAAGAKDGSGAADDDSGVEVEYVQEKSLVDITNPLYSQFHKIFEAFKIEESTVEPMEDKPVDEDVKTEKKPESDTTITKRGAALFGELEDDEDERAPRDAGALSKKQLKKLTRMSVAQLKTVVTRPDLVEMHDVTGPDPKLLLLLKATRNTVPVPRHWCNKRKYLQGKRGFEKPPFELPDYIQATGIMEMRQALADKETDKSMKQKMREKVRPKMGKIDIDYQKLHDAFFKHQRKPKMTEHGDLYYEGKEFETRLREKKPGNLTDELRTALGMPIGAGAERFPPPWLIAMQRYGPPPSYPNLKIPGLNAAIPEGCSFGYHAGGWGKPPVDELGKPLYGDVFGQRDEQEAEPVNEDTMDKTHWGEMESESEEESESESEEERDDDEMAAGLVTPADAGLITPSGLTSIPAGMETPDAIELRKKIEDSMDAGGGDTPALYQVLPEKRTSVGAAMMGSAHTYEVGAAKKMTAEGVEVTLNPEELDMDTVAMQAKYDQTVRQQQADIQKEDFSDMVAEHSAKAAKKRKKQQGSDKASKKHKEFKF